MTDAPNQPATSPNAGQPGNVVSNSPFHQPTRPDPVKWANMSPSARRAHDAASARVADPWSDPSVTITRDADDKIVIGKASNSENNQDPVRSPLDPAEHVAADTGEKIKIGDMTATEAEIREALAAKAAADSRKLSLPQTPGELKLELPADLKLPNGVKFEFKENDPYLRPAIDAARSFAHENGLGQAGFSKMLGIYAASLAHQQAALNAAQAAEQQKLGAAGPARADAVIMALRAELGDELARPLILTMCTEKHVVAYEKMIQRRTSQGVGSFSGGGRDPQLSEHMSDEAYDKMSPRQQLEYAQRSQQTNSQRRR